MTENQKHAIRTAAAAPRLSDATDQAWLNFLDLPPDSLSEMTLEDFQANHWGKMDATKRDRAVARWKVFTDGSKAAQVSNIVSFEKQLLSSLKLSKFITKDTRGSLKGNEKDRFLRIEAEAARLIEGFETTELQGKRKASPSERKGIIDGLIKDEVVIEGFFFDKTLPISGLSKDERGNVTVPLEKIPEQNQRKIENLMRANGVIPTADKVSRAYGAFRVKDRASFNKLLQGVR